MKIVITQVANGYIVEKGDQQYIAASLDDSAKLVGDYQQWQPAHYMKYKENMSAKELERVRQLMHQGFKIEAIKLLRSCFVPTMALREAKDIIEALY
jgi:ribosomal protein L7/L12